MRREKRMLDKIISTALGEVGYVEKASNAFLYDKTANAGDANYTKYWAEIKPEYQGQPWCAAFVSWVFMEALGKQTAEKLLKHFPYVYVPTIANLFERHANPKRGDIVCFYRNGEFVHTGIVTSVSGDRFETVEGNTSGGSNVISNGGGVCKKSYYNSKLPGTKFVRPDYESAEPRELTSVNDIVWELRERGIVSETDKWLQKLQTDTDAYWLARKTVKFLRGKRV